MNDEVKLESLLVKLSGQLDLLQKNDLRQELIDSINYFLLHDFNRVIQVLYRVDVSETKLKTLLKENPQRDAADIIADLIIRRQEEKIKSRESFRSQDETPEADKW
jgi:hypothetical protein